MTKNSAKKDSLLLGDAENARAAPSTRERILSAGLAEFSTHGRFGASTGRIVAAAGCNIRMLYHYFGNKEGLYRAALLKVFDDLRIAENKAHFWSLPPCEALVGLTHFTFDYMNENSAFPRMILVENLAGGEMIRDLNAPFAGSRDLIVRLDRLLDDGHASGAFGRRPPCVDLYLTVLALSFIHVSNRHTLSVTFGVDFDAQETIASRRGQAVAAVLGYVGARDDR